MNLFRSKILSAVVVPWAMIAFAACSTPPIPDPPPPAGAVQVDTMTMTATVTAIDPAKRRITLVGPNGGTATYTAGPDIINFNQLKVGDRVSAKVVEELAVFLRPKGTPASVGEATAVALSPRGEMPGGMLVNTVEVTATVLNVDPVNQTLTLQFVDGAVKTVHVTNSVNVLGVKTGDSVVARITEGLLIRVQNP